MVSISSMLMGLCIGIVDGSLYRRCRCISLSASLMGLCIGIVDGSLHRRCRWVSLSAEYRCRSISLGSPTAQSCRREAHTTCIAQQWPRKPAPTAHGSTFFIILPLLFHYRGYISIFFIMLRHDFIHIIIPFIIDLAQLPILD